MVGNLGILLGMLSNKKEWAIYLSQERVKLLDTSQSRERGKLGEEARLWRILTTIEPYE